MRFAEHLSQAGHGMREAVLLDDPAGPEIGQQPVLRKQLATVLDEIDQGVDDFRRHR
jgi:hypothetical protein